MTELPWFKFNPSLWLSGDISCLSYETQGIFIKICSLYWKNGCSLGQAKLKRRLSNATVMLEHVLTELEDENIIDISGDDISIKFLDEQHEELNASHARRVTAGSKGGKKRVSNAQAMLKKGLSIKKEEEDTEEEIDTQDLFNGQPSLANELSDSNLRHDFAPFIEYRPDQMGDIYSQLRHIISKSSLKRTLSQAEKLSNAEGGKFWIGAFMSKFLEVQSANK